MHHFTEIYQDRLGTNTGKTQTEMRFPQVECEHWKEYLGW